ncbi:MAG TPA: hypothetical protein VE008_07235 [Burkholderiales bacterium]|nr:hypothetical protein [Burkholderiales bacterium]
MSESIYAGLPASFGSPRAAAARIVDLPTLVERERFFLSVPAPWRGMIAHFARIGLAAFVVIAEELEERQRRLTEVPPAWRAEVESHVKRLWSRREELRAGWRPGRKSEQEGE